MAFIREAGAFAGGLLVAGSASHPATAVTGHTHLTPLAGRRPPLRPVRDRVRGGQRGVALWMAGSETVLLVNAPDPVSGGGAAIDPRRA